jgi:hypothetical protein
MAGVFSPQQQFANVERGFEFSRLHEEWMAAVYVLVVPGRPATRRQRLGVSGGPDQLVPQGRLSNTERRAG